MSCTGESECGCNGNNCPHKTSEVTSFDGIFTSITVPSGASLNDVLALLENYATQTATCSDVNFTLGAYSACLNLPAGTYSFQQIIEAIINRSCTNAQDIANLTTEVNNIVLGVNTNTTQVLLDNIILPSCFSTFTGTTSTNLFNLILSELCGLLGVVAPVIGDPTIYTDPDPGTEADPNPPNTGNKNSNARIETVAEAIKSLADNDSFIYEHIAPSVSPTSFTVRLSPMRGVIEGYLCVRTISEDLAVNATKDTYFFLNGKDNSILRREVAVGAPAPATPSSSYELYKIESDGSGVVGVTTLYITNPMNDTPLAANSVVTSTIKDGVVTPAKLTTMGTLTPGTYGNAGLFQIRVNTQGLVEIITANADFTGIADKDVMIYNAGLSKFEVGANTNIANANILPKANAAGTDYEDSSISESATQVSVIKPTEVNVGTLENDSNSILNLVSTDKYFLPPRITHTAGAALPLTDGAMVYIISTGGVFTSIGFWGVEAGVWIKL